MLNRIQRKLLRNLRATQAFIKLSLKPLSQWRILLNSRILLFSRFDGSDTGALAAGVMNDADFFAAVKRKQKIQLVALSAVEYHFLCFLQSKPAFSDIEKHFGFNQAKLLVSRMNCIGLCRYE